MAFKLVELPYEKNALAPHIGEDTIETHYEKHHRSLDEIISSSSSRSSAFPSGRFISDRMTSGWRQ